MRLLSLGRFGFIGLFVVVFIVNPTVPIQAQDPFASQITWTGQTSAQWNLSTNWSGGIVPGAADAALFSGTFANQPRLTANATVGALYVHNIGQNITPTADLDINTQAVFVLTLQGVVSSGTNYGILIDNTNGSFTMSIATALKINSAQTWMNNSGNLFTVTGTVDLNGLALTIDGNSDTTITGAITGNGSSTVTKNGTGTLTYGGSTANNYGGATTVNAGTLVLAQTNGVTAINGPLVIGDGVGIDTVRLGNSNQIANKAVTINSSGVLNLNFNSDVIGSLTMTGGIVVTETGTFALGGNVTTNAFTDSSIISGNFSLGSAGRTFTVADGAAADDLLISANITGNAQTLTKAGTGRMVLSGTNTLKDVSISGGTLTLRSSDALGTAATPTVSTGATMELEGGISINNATKINGTGVGGQGALLNVSGNNTMSGVITLNADSTIGSNSGTLLISNTLDGNGRDITFVGPGNTSVTGPVIDNGSAVIMNGTGVVSLFGTNTYGGGTTINSGTLQANSASSLGKTGVSATINAGTLEITSSFSAARELILGSSSSTVQVDPGQTFIVGPANAFSGTGGTLNKTGDGTLLLSGVNIYTGGTNITAGTIQLGATNTIPNNGPVSITNGTLDMQTFSDAVGPLTLHSGSIIGSGTLVSSSYTGESGSISAPLGAGGTLTKTTAGTVTLSGNNTFTGSTTVNAGTLVLATSGGSALGATSGITVNSGGTLLLGASNQINNSAGVTLAGGTFAAGNFSEGTAASGGMGALTLAGPGSIVDFGIGTGSALSFLNLVSGGNTLTLNNWTGTPNTVGNAGTDRLIFDVDQTANLSFFTFSGYLGATQLDLNNGFFEIVPVAVPEPSTWATGVLALAGLVYFVRKQRQTRRLSARGLAVSGSGGKRFTLSFAVITCLSCSSASQANPRDEIQKAVAVHRVADVSQASSQQVTLAFTAVAVRVEPDSLPEYTMAAINLRPDLTPNLTATAVRAAWANREGTTGPAATFQPRRAELCQLVNAIVKGAVTANPNAAARIAAATVLACPAMRQCILEGALAAAPSAKKEIYEAVMEVSLPETDSVLRRAGDHSLAPVVSPEQPPD